MHIELSSEREIKRFNSIASSKVGSTSGYINVSKLKKDKSEKANFAKENFMRKPFYYNYDENGIFKDGGKPNVNASKSSKALEVRPKI